MGNIRITTLGKALPLISLLLLAGCSAAATAPTLTAPLLGIEAATVVGTKKTLVDHAVSFVKGKDCSTVRANQGRTYCLEDEVAPAQEIYCYETLGGVDCFRDKKPYGTNSHEVGHTVPGSAPPR